MFVGIASGWGFGTALPGARVAGNKVEFATVSLTTLVGIS